MSLFKENLLPSAQTSGTPPAGAPGLLVVDDEVANLRVLRTLFGQDYRVFEATDGAAALELMLGLPPAERPAVILSDQRMPRMTGVDLFERLRTETPEAIRIIITGYVDVAAIVDAINRAGIYQFVVKPFDREDLRLTVERALEAFRMRRQIERHVEELEHKVRERTRELEERNSALRQAYAEIERASLTDPLTGLGNRRALVAAIENRSTDAACACRCAMLLLDVDHFKAVNDTWGHAAGDAVLRGVSAVVAAHTRPGEFAARWGGEEFLLLAMVAGEAEALARAEALRAAVAALQFDLGECVSRTCSIGVACWPFDPAEPARLGWEQVIALADAALYMAKHGGRNSVVALRARESLPASVGQSPGAVLDGLVAAGIVEVARSP